MEFVIIYFVNEWFHVFLLGLSCLRDTFFFQFSDLVYNWRVDFLLFTRTVALLSKYKAYVEVIVLYYHCTELEAWS